MGPRVSLVLPEGHGHLQRSFLRWLCNAYEPARQNVVWDLLLRNGNSYGLRPVIGRVTIFIGLAVLLLPSNGSLGLTALWIVFLLGIYFYTILVPCRLARRLRRGVLPELLLAPICTRSYAQAYRQFFQLATSYFGLQVLFVSGLCAYELSVRSFEPYHGPEWLAWFIGVAALLAGVVSVAWFSMWCQCFGGVIGLLPIGVVILDIGYVAAQIAQGSNDAEAGAFMMQTILVPCLVAAGYFLYLVYAGYFGHEGQEFLD